MADIIQVTQGAIRIASSENKPFLCPLHDVVDVGGYDVVELFLQVLHLTNGINMNIGIDASMQMQVGEGEGTRNWIRAVDFTAPVGDSNYEASSDGTAAQVKVLGASGTNPLLRYLRWRIKSNESSSWVLVFQIRGMARRLG